MPSCNPDDPPQLEKDDAPEDEPPPAATEIIRAIPTAILGSILLSYAVTFALAKWTRPPPEARLNATPVLCDPATCGGGVEVLLGDRAKSPAASVASRAAGQANAFKGDVNDGAGPQNDNAFHPKSANELRGSTNPMSNPNPYQPPRTTDPLTTVKAVKRGVGLLVILLLTPVAVVITGGISCAAGATYFNAFGNLTGPPDHGLVALSIFLVPPILVLLGMLGWAVARSMKRAEAPVSSAESGDEPVRSDQA
jgi:hypothetical protein